MHKSGIAFLIILISTLQTSAQDLDPRAYARAPVKGTILISGFAYLNGNVVTDPSLPLKDLKANVQTLSLGVARTFSMFGCSAQAFAAMPYSFAEANALVNGQPESVSRTGFGDMRMRLAVLIKGAPAVTLSEMRKEKPKPRQIIGVSTTIVAPLGQYFSDKLINLGTNRWSFKPEVALSQPINSKWLMDLYAGVWFFTKNNSFFTGESIKTQDPLAAFQGHLSYNINLRMWAALDLTYYVGGNSTIDGVKKDDRQSNSRLGATFVFPTGKMNSLKLAASTGAIVRSGANFTIFSIGWQHSWYRLPH
jgi:hypothetical protein